MKDPDLDHYERQARALARDKTIAHLVARHPRVAPRSRLHRLCLRLFWVLLHPTDDIGPRWRESARLVCEPDPSYQGASGPRRPARVGSARL